MSYMCHINNSVYVHSFLVCIIIDCIHSVTASKIFPLLSLVHSITRCQSQCDVMSCSTWMHKCLGCVCVCVLVDMYASYYTITPMCACAHVHTHINVCIHKHANIWTRSHMMLQCLLVHSSLSVQYDARLFTTSFNCRTLLDPCIKCLLGGT